MYRHGVQADEAVEGGLGIAEPGLPIAAELGTPRGVRMPVRTASCSVAEPRKISAGVVNAVEKQLACLPEGWLR